MLPALDEDIAERLLRCARAVALFGARAILSGVSPSVAMMAVRHGIDLTSLHPESWPEGQVAPRSRGVALRRAVTWPTDATAAAVGFAAGIRIRVV